MESDESRPDSSASNSSDSSDNSDNSRQSSPERPVVSPEQKSHQSAGGSSSRKSRSRTRSHTKSPSNQSKSGSPSSSSSSEEEDNQDEPDHHRGTGQFIEAVSADGQINEPKIADNDGSASSRSSSNTSSRSGNAGDGNISRNQSISPVRKSSSSRDSSASSAASRTSNAPGNNDDDNDNKEPALNMSHEDLSDVSDMESERNDKRSSRRGSHDSEDEEEPINEPAVKENGDNSDHDHDNEPISRKPDSDQEEEDEDPHEQRIITDLRQKLDQKKNQLKAMESKDRNGETTPMKSNGSVSEDLDDLVKKHDEDALDFEAEEGECQDVSNEEEKIEKDLKEKEKKEKDGELEDGEELEEGEVSDEEEKRPEETEPKPVCRFYTRGQCTWGMNCRFLHPGVTDKGNYTMFEMVRPVPVPHGGGFQPAHPFHDYRNERPPLHHRPPMHHHPAYVVPHHEPRVIPAAIIPDQPVPMVESAWERGLRTAKEMMRKANKRKEQDMDFEDKKMNLTLSQEELEKDNYYIRDRASPPEVGDIAAAPPFAAGGGGGGGRHPNAAGGHFEATIYSPPAGKFAGRGPPVYDEDPYGRTVRYRELPPHRMPQYEDERRVRPAREVIVQRAEPAGRGDEWNDPWMRSKSPGGRGFGSERERSDKRVRRERRSYSSNSSYSSSSTSRSGSSSDSSRSPSPDTRRRRYNSTHSSSHKSPARRHIKAIRSRSPRVRRSPTAHVTISDFKEHKVKKTVEIVLIDKEYQDKLQMPPPSTIPSQNNQRHKKNPNPILKNANSSSHSATGDPKINSPKGSRRSPVKKRGRISTSPISEKRIVVSPVSKRKKILEPTRKVPVDKARKRRRAGSSSSGSDSSDSSGSESDSSYSSSSDSSSRGNTPVKRTRTEKTASERKNIKKVDVKKRSPIIMEMKKSSTATTADNSAAISSKKTTRREELLKQLRAVEEAIAKKRSKLN